MLPSLLAVMTVLLKATFIDVAMVALVALFGSLVQEVGYLFFN